MLDSKDPWEHVGGTGLWKEHVNSQTGESSIKEHKLKTVWTSCPKGECYFEITNSPRRECTCTKCGAVETFILGPQIVKDGKIVTVHSGV